MTTCHAGECAPCDVAVSVPCRCGMAVRTLPCHASNWLCERVCGGALACGHHTCSAVCHAGACPPCALSQPRRCPCSKSVFTLPCTEPTPRCGDTCGKPLSCGHHTCCDPCHDGLCRPCDEVILRCSVLVECPDAVYRPCVSGADAVFLADDCGHVPLRKGVQAALVQ